MLEDLFSNVGAEEKKQKMTEKHGLTVSTELEGRFNFMCNLSDVIEERALEKGQEIGKEIGKQIGQLKTYVRMYEKGLINDVQIKEETGYTIETARKFLEKYEN